VTRITNNPFELLDGHDLSEYMVMRDNGCTPIEVYIHAAKHGSEEFRAPKTGTAGYRILLLRKLFGLSLFEALEVLGDAHRLDPAIKIEGEFYS
jgi:hypothetical protein